MNYPNNCHSTVDQTYAAIIGGGAAGIFAAIQTAKRRGASTVTLLEQTQHPLAKVKISGGGRCNVTHHCFEPKELIKNYPRGSKELLSPFYRFGPQNTIDWFSSRGVALKSEADGRIFPVTDSSETIIECLMGEARREGVQIRKGAKVTQVEKGGKGFLIHLASGKALLAKRLLLATGSTRKGFEIAIDLGHTIEEPVPSLFTFNTPTSPLIDLPGISLDSARASLPEFGLSYTGPLLLTHWGFSGPAVLKLSAFGARHLHSCGYTTELQIDWLPDIPQAALERACEEARRERAGRSIAKEPLFKAIPKNLWRRLSLLAEVEEELCWSQLSNRARERLCSALKRSTFRIEGKSTYKSEFVTCGGVKREEVDFHTMQSKLVPSLFFAGELLDIDGITGGFNFQAAWTTGYLADL